MNKVFKVLPHMCSAQRDFMDRVMVAADSIGAAASSISSNGSQGYESLLEARKRFKEELCEMMENSRVCIEEEEP